MKDLVDLMLENYSSRDTAWAAISRTVKKLASLKLIEDKENDRFSYIKTTLKGKMIVQESIPLELVADDRIKFLIKELKTRDFDSSKLKEIILELFSKYGKLSFEDLNNLLQLPKDILENELNDMKDKLKKEIIKVDEKEQIYYFINWKLLFSPIKDILKNKEKDIE